MTVIFSTLCALTIVPWMTYLLLKKAASRQDRMAGAANCSGRRKRLTRIHRFYRADWSRRFSLRRTRRYGLLIAVLMLLIVPVGLAHSDAPGAAQNAAF
jgi:multidrug efflux pump subunit AcrB